MEFVDGADLKEVLEHLQRRREHMRVEVAVRIAQDICEGLAYAHQARDHAGQPLDIVHRDVSPHNVLMTRHGEVKLVDFGLAKASSHLTADDEDIVKGKFGYLAPEVTLGQGADKRVDIFAAGILLWEMLTGRRLFLGDSDLETFKAVQAANIPDPRQFRPEVPEDVVRVLAKALARDRDQRYATADALAHDLGLLSVRLQAPASYLDIGALVRAAAGERKSDKTGESDVVMGDLIIDALHDFSGEPGGVAPADEPSRLGTPGVDAGGGGYVDPSEWGLDSLFDEPEPARAPPPSAAAPAAAPAAAAPQGPPRQAPPPPRARVQESPPKKEGPFWRRWFSG
jgi:serine/threonine-protein kinase